MRRVSVVMPVYNAEATLCRSVESVLAQTHRDLELVAVDDGSRDASPGMLAAFAKADSRVKVIRQDNAGVAAARNAGLRAASGTHVAFLDSDDWWHASKVQRQLDHLDATGARIAYACYQRVDESGALLSTVRPPVQVDYPAMLRSNRIGNLTGLYDRTLGDAVFQRIGHEDYAFWLEMVRRAGHAVRVGSEPLAWYCVRSRSLSSDKAKAARWQWNIYRNIERLSVPLSAWYFLHYAGNALTKRR